MVKRDYYHTVGGVRKKCSLLLSPRGSDAYWHLCDGSIVALSIPTMTGVRVHNVKNREHAAKVEQYMMDLNERAQMGLLVLEDFEKGRSISGIDLLLTDLNIQDYSVLRSYANLKAARATAGRRHRRRQRWEGETPPWLARRVKIKRHTRRV